MEPPSLVPKMSSIIAIKIKAPNIFYPFYNNKTGEKKVSYLI